jgi:hypothetical protein
MQRILCNAHTDRILLVLRLCEGKEVLPQDALRGIHGIRVHSINDQGREIAERSGITGIATVRH